ncbi:MAG: PAS domain-containing protein, partial [Deltaproteobacteria bacterium]
MTGEVRVSDRFAAMLGVPAGVTVRRRDELRARIHPDDQERVRAAFEAALAGPGEYDVEYRSL